MGTHNRDRRRQKKRRQEAAARARERRRAEANGLPGSDLDAADIERLLFTAVAAHRDGDDDVEYEVAELLALHGPGHGGDPLVDAVVARCLRREVAGAGEQGWAAADLDRAGP